MNATLTKIPFSPQVGILVVALLFLNHKAAAVPSPVSSGLDQSQVVLTEMWNTAASLTPITGGTGAFSAPDRLDSAILIWNDGSGLKSLVSIHNAGSFNADETIIDWADGYYPYPKSAPGIIAVPEVGSMLLLFGAGFIGLLAFRRRFLPLT